jgi:hypothetical protein
MENGKRRTEKVRGTMNGIMVAKLEPRMARIIANEERTPRLVRHLTDTICRRSVTVRM